MSITHAGVCTQAALVSYACTCRSLASASLTPKHPHPAAVVRLRMQVTTRTAPLWWPYVPLFCAACLQALGAQHHDTHVDDCLDMHAHATVLFCAYPDLKTAHVLTHTDIMHGSMFPPM